MARRCAFCPETAKLTGEHLWSDWMSDLFPGNKRFTSKDEQGKIVADWHSSKLDWKAKVVCKQCNSSWMSDIENSHAKPAMSDLIRGVEGEVSQSRARSIALFAFKTAIVFDHLQKRREPFFSRSVCFRFRESLDIPPTVRMWMAGFTPLGKGHVHTCYHEGELSPFNRLELYVCTYAVGHFVFQVVAERGPSFIVLSAQQGFEYLAVPFWPSPPKGFIWPASYVLLTVKDFDDFSMRWRSPQYSMPTGRG